MENKEGLPGLFFLSTFRLFCFGFLLKEPRPYIFSNRRIKAKEFTIVVLPAKPVQIQAGWIINFVSVLL